MNKKIKTYKYIFVVCLSLLVAGLIWNWQHTPRSLALPTPPPSAADLVQQVDVLQQNNNNQIRIKLKHNGLTLTPDGIETGELSYTMNLSEIYSSGNIRNRRHLTLREEVSSDGKFSYYLNYNFFPATTHTPTAVCQQEDLTRKAYAVGYQNLDAKPFTDGWPYVNWWPDGVDVVIPYSESDLGNRFCFEIPNHQPSGGSNYLYRSNRFYHDTRPPSLSATELTYQASTTSHKTTLTAGLRTDPQAGYVSGAVKIYKYSITQVPKGTANCHGDNLRFKAITSSDSGGRYTASVSSSPHLAVTVDFLKPGWGKTYCFAVWDNEGHRGVSAPVVVPQAQSVRIITTGNKWVFEHAWAQFACPIPGYLGLTETTNYIMTTGGGGASNRNTGINVLLNRYIRERFGAYSLQTKETDSTKFPGALGGPFTLDTKLKHIHDALSYTDAGEVPYVTFALNRWKHNLHSNREVRDHKVSASALSGLVFNLQAAFGIELERPATTRTTISYTTGGGPVTGVSKATGTAATAFGEIRLDGTEDYVRKSGTVVFEPGEQRKYVFISIVNDCIDDSDERVYLTLEKTSNTNTGDAALNRWFAGSTADPDDYYIIKNHDGSPNANVKPSQPTIRSTPEQPDNDDDSDNTDAVWARVNGAGGYCWTRGLDRSNWGSNISESRKAQCPSDKEWLPIGVCTRADGSTYSTLEPICTANNKPKAKQPTETETEQQTTDDTEDQNQEQTTDDTEEQSQEQETDTSGQPTNTQTGSSSSTDTNRQSTQTRTTNNDVNYQRATTQSQQGSSTSSAPSTDDTDEAVPVSSNDTSQQSTGDQTGGSSTSDNSGSTPENSNLVSVVTSGTKETPVDASSQPNQALTQASLNQQTSSSSSNLAQIGKIALVFAIGFLLAIIYKLYFKRRS